MRKSARIAALVAGPIMVLGIGAATAAPAFASTGPIEITTQSQANQIMASGGVINKSIDIPAGAVNDTPNGPPGIQLRYVDVHGNTTVEGQLSLASSTMEGNVTVSGPAAGLSLFNDPGNTIWGSLTVNGAGGDTSLGDYSVGQQVNGGLTFTSNTGRLYVGYGMHVNGKFVYSGNAKPYTPSDVPGLTIGGTSSISS